MAFITTIVPLTKASPTRQLCLSARKRTPHKSQRAILQMNAQNSEEEVSVPISALQNYQTTPESPAASPTESPPESPIEEEEEDTRSEAQKEIDRLRAAEKFITIDEGIFECTACSYLYDPKKGERQQNIPAGTAFEDIPGSFYCPVCRSPKSRFVSKKKVIAGFADNQKYGFGSNTMTSGQKSALIYGGLVFFFLLLLSGYALN